jgi:C4-dicarboxylate-specific signal transduction histidine kinase
MQVLTNLLGSVQRYAYPDGRGRAVEVLVSTVGDGFMVHVRVVGAGSPLEALDQMCSPVCTSGRGRGGTGLGIVQNIVVSGFSGKPEITSTPGNGTTVTVHLPRVAPDLPVGG